MQNRYTKIKISAMYTYYVGKLVNEIRTYVQRDIHLEQVGTT